MNARDPDLERAIVTASSLFLTAVKRQWLPDQEVVDLEELDLWMKRNANLVDAAVLPQAVDQMVKDRIFERRGDNLAPTPAGRRVLHLDD